MDAYDARQQQHEYELRYPYHYYPGSGSGPANSSSQIPRPGPLPPVPAAAAVPMGYPTHPSTSAPYVYPQATVSSSSSHFQPLASTNGSGSVGSGGSGPSSSYSGSVHSSPEGGARLDDFPYATAAVNNGSSGGDNTSATISGSVAGKHATPPQHRSILPTGSSSSSALSAAAGPSSLYPSTSVSVLGGTPLSRPLTHKEQELLAHLDRLKFFLATAPSRWSDSEVPQQHVEDLNPVGIGAIGMGRMPGPGGPGGPGGAQGMQQGTPMMPHPNMHPALNRFLLPSGEFLLF